MINTSDITLMSKRQSDSTGLKTPLQTCALILDAPNSSLDVLIAFSLRLKWQSGRFQSWLF